MFRPAVLSLFLCIGSLALPLFLFLVFLTDGFHPDEVLLVASVGVVLSSGLAAWILHFLFPVRISADAVAGHSVWGLRRSIRWEHIASVRPICFVNLRFLRLFSTIDRKVTWLALFPSDPVAFRAALTASMPSDSPMAAHLAKA